MVDRAPLIKPDIGEGQKIYFMGIGGTGMGAAAGLLHEAGFKICGSDAGLYPPMSTVLENLGIDVHCPYGPDNLAIENPDLVVVANALSRGHEELEALLSSEIPYTSFPALLGDLILKKRTTIVVSGTHGKTTTTALLAHTLSSLGHDPGYMIGGLPKGHTKSFHLGSGKVFVIEGDEYDTAYFDKGPKFLHYHPKYLLFNNLEYDHADIYDSIEQIEERFQQVIDLCPKERAVIAFASDPGVAKLIRAYSPDRFQCVGREPNPDRTYVKSLHPPAGEQLHWKIVISSPAKEDVVVFSSLGGEHNAANIAQVVATVWRLAEDEVIPPLESADLGKAISSFPGVQRRMDLLAAHEDIEVYEDFAHHPTAVKLVIQGFRQANPNKRLLVAFEPRNATSRRATFTEQFATALSCADLVFIGKCPQDERIPADERMNTERLCELIGGHAQSFSENQELLNAVSQKLSPGDGVIFMSSGSFSGVQHQLASAVSNRKPEA